MPDFVTINSKQYEISPLRLKHMRQITKMLADVQNIPNAGNLNDLERFMPFILDSVRVKNPDFLESELDEMTLQEFTEAWQAIVSVSGIKIVPRGEVKPAPISTGNPSMDGLRSVSDTPIQ